MILPTIFKNQNRYQQTFKATLSSMLEQSDELGVFVLVLANSTYDPEIYRQFKPQLRSKFEYFKQRYEQLKDKSILGAIDDVLVFEKLMKIGFEHCGINQKRMQGEWHVHFNPLRSLRPSRNSQLAFNVIQQPFDRTAFHFNKPFLVKEELWQGDIGEKNCRLLLNKFPFADYHSLLVVDSHLEKNQWLEKSDFFYVWALMQSLQKNIPNMALSYNSLAAAASINHQHFQLSLKATPVALIESSSWLHNDGLKQYPLKCTKCLTAQTSWDTIHRMQKSHTAFNWILLQQSLYIVERKKQGEYSHAHWTAGFAWSEVFGTFSVQNEEDYLSLDNQLIQQEFEKINNAVK